VSGSAEAVKIFDGGVLLYSEIYATNFPTAETEAAFPRIAHEEGMGPGKRLRGVAHGVRGEEFFCLNRL
jgi:hypothetical protein